MPPARPGIPVVARLAYELGLAYLLSARCSSAWPAAGGRAKRGKRDHSSGNSLKNAALRRQSELGAEKGKD
jgi:hypothetical protein